ncbi:hypothetical protein [Aestuariimicrobium ganziense]|uniref:hypothetical protein n=1 Tax=Aestuariimicrobium ganziense TaxID=2773677 RepID=UPI0019450507|nr:hypothetical protein [Aestuariimicrobium ganziense]
MIVDAGRIGSGLPSPLLEHADTVLVVTRSSLRALAALRLHLPGLLDALDLAAPQARSGMAVIGEGQPYQSAEITSHFGVPALAVLPDEPRHAAVLSDAAPAPRRFDSGSWAKALRSSALRLSTMVGTRARSDVAVPAGVGR